MPSNITHRLQARGATAFLSPSRISIVFPKVVRTQPQVSEASARTPSRERVPAEITALYRVDWQLLGTRPEAFFEGWGVTSSVIRSLKPEGETVTTGYESLIAREIYPGIDLVLHGREEGVKYEFHIRPGADPRNIRIKWSGASQYDLAADGSLRVSCPLGRITDSAPVSFQENRKVVTRFREAGEELRFEVDEYDRGKALIIDPFLQWSTFYGGSTSDYARAIAQDAAGNTYVCGYTASVNFPVTQGAYQGKHAGGLDAFVLKLDLNRKVQWATYFGGSDGEESPHIAVEANGACVMAGQTFSTNLPVSGGAPQMVNNGKSDVFILKLDPSGRRLWSTYFGGTFSDECNGVAIDSNNEIVITGGTFSTNFPVTRNALQTSNSGDFEVFVTKFSSEGQLVWSTYYGGWSMDYANAVKTDAGNNIYVTGQTESTNFPVSSGAYQSRYGGGAFDMFLLKLSSSGTRVWATYFGGEKEDAALGIAIDPTGEVFISGRTESYNFPVSKNATQRNNAGLFDAFVARFDGKGSFLLGTYFGGTKNDFGTALALNADGDVYLTGYTESADLFITPDGFQRRLSGLQDVFLARVNREGKLLWSSYFGGNDQDIGYSLAVDRQGNATVVGSTGSWDFPRQGPALQKERAGYTDAFMLTVIFDEPVANAGPDTVICLGSSANIGLPVRRGRPPYRYAWTPAAGLSTDKVERPVATPRQTTMYVLTVTDANGSLSTDSVVVEVRTAPRARAGNDVTICPGTELRLTPTVTGGLSPYWYTWSPADGLNSQDIMSPVAKPERTTTYVLTVRDFNGCIGKDTITIEVLPTVVADAGTDVTICQGAFTIFTARASGGLPPYSYAWKPATGLSDANVANPIASPDTITKYHLTVTDSKGCKSFDSVLVRVNPSATRIDVGTDVSICQGEGMRIGGGSVFGKPPFRYAWTPAKGLNATDISSPFASPDVTTTYIVSVTDANNCGGRDTITVSVHPKSQISAGADVNMCEGSTTPIGNPATGGTPPFTYRWEPSAGLDNPSSPTPVARPEKSTRYTVTTVDANGCKSTSSIMVNVYPVPRAKLDPNLSICRGSKRKITVSARGGKGPYRYEWLPRRGLSEYDGPTPVASPDITTTYTVTVIDANGCRSVDSIRITVRPCDKADAGPDVEICRGGETAIGGTFPVPANEPVFRWTPSAGLSTSDAAQPVASPKTTTTYVLTVTNMFGCEDRDTVTVRVSPGPTANAGPSVHICENGSVQIGRSATGGVPPYRYQWTPAEGLSNSGIVQPFAAPRATTTYTVTVTDANGCANSDNVLVTVHPLPVVQLPRSVELCAGTSAELVANASAGGPFSFSWWPKTGLSAPTSGRTMLTPLATTTYLLTVTNRDGCETRDSVRAIVRPLPAPVISASGPTQICDGESVTLSVAGNFPRYEWSNGARTAQTVVNKSGTYFLTVEDEHGCRATSNRIAVAVNAMPLARITAKGSTVICEGEEVLLDAGKGFARYRWTGGETTQIVRARKSGDYVVTVTNSAGCASTSEPVTVTVKQRPIAVVEASRDTLLAVPASDYQWLLDGKPIKGATTRDHIATRSGRYAVMTGWKSDCPATSAGKDIIFAETTIALDKVTASREDTVRIPLRIVSESLLDQSGATEFLATVRLKKKALAVLAPADSWHEDDGDLVVTMRGRRTRGLTILAVLECSVTREAPARITAILEDFRWLNGLAHVKTRNGEVRVVDAKTNRRNR